jgi:hypothetical protein
VFGAVLAASTVGSIVLSNVLIAHNETTRIYYGTDTRAPELLIGALLAIVLFRRPRATSGPVRIASKYAAIVSLGVLLYLWSTVQQSDRWLYKGGFALHALLVAIVLAELLIEGPLTSLLGVRPLRDLGRISYGVYLYHWPVFLWLGVSRFPTWSRSELFVLRFVVTIAIATASFVWLEKPVQRALGGIPRGTKVAASDDAADTARATKWWPALVAPLVVVALIAAVLFIPRPAATPNIEFSAISSKPPPSVNSSGGATPGQPVAGHTITTKPAPVSLVGDSNYYHRPLTSDRPLRVLVVGDSVGQTLGRGIELWGLHTHEGIVWNDAHYYCSLGRFAPRIAGIGIAGPQGGVCDAWGTRWPDELKRFDPDVTILLYTIWELIPRKPPGATDFLKPGNPQLDAWQLSEYQKAADTLSAQGGKVVWLTVPCIHTTGPFASNALDNREIKYENSHQIAAVARMRPNAVRVIDLNKELCPGGQFQSSFDGVQDARPDGAHFSDPGAEAVADWLMKRIMTGSTK